MRTHPADLGALNGMSRRSDSCLGVKSFKDPVHGYNDICTSLAPVVDSPLLQRLRWIRQTGHAYLVYHGMEHSRFNHSLGAAHLAREVIEFVAGNTRLYYRSGGGDLAIALTDSVEVFQLAALIHDIGHLPYSHSSEVAITDAATVFGVREFNELPRRHEEYTYRLIPLVAAVASEEGRVEPRFTNRLSDDLNLILRGPGLAPASSQPLTSWCVANLLHRLISSGLDVDRMDYLLRDSIYAGVRYGVFDVDRLIRVLLAVPVMMSQAGRGLGIDPDTTCNLAVLDKGLSVVENFLLARFYMFSEVYLHRVVETYNSIHARLLAVLARDGVVTVLGGGGELEIPHPDDLEKGESDAVEAWIGLDDTAASMLYRRVAAGSIPHASSEARHLAEMLLRRRHMRVYRVLEDREVWALYKSYLDGNPPPSGTAAELLKELLELQRENPLLIIRPLRVDLVSLEGVYIYYRKTGGLVPVNNRPGSGGDAVDAEARRLRKLAELGLYRIAVFATREDEGKAEKAIQKLKELRETIHGQEKA